MTERSKTIILTEKNFREKVLEDPEPILVEIGADWCGSCHIMAPVLEKLAAEYRGRLRYGKIDIDTNKRVANELGVSELPFLLFFKDGQIIDHIIGATPRKVIETRIRKLLDSADNNNGRWREKGIPMHRSEET